LQSFQPLLCVFNVFNWGEDRLWFQDKVGRLHSLPTSWTDVGTVDPFVAIAAGRSLFRGADLMELARLIDRSENGPFQARLLALIGIRALRFIAIFQDIFLAISLAKLGCIRDPVPNGWGTSTFHCSLFMPFLKEAFVSYGRPTLESEVGKSYFLRTSICITVFQK
jgi:hypothetical protein